MYPYTGSGGLFENFGTLVKSEGVGTTSLDIPVSNAGTIRVQSGTLRFDDSSDHDGEVIGEEGGALEFRSGPHVFSEFSSLSAVGDVTFGGVTADSTGGDHLLPGTLSSVELNATNGAPFAVVDPSTLSVVGMNGDIVFAQSSVTAFLKYGGTLTDIENVTPLFGTDGVAVVPEPGTGLLMALGLFVMGVRARREA